MDYSLSRIIAEVTAVMGRLDGSELPTVKAYNDDDISAANVFRRDLMAYVIYLCYSDERVSRSEKTFLKEYLDVELSYDEIRDFSRENAIDADNFAHRIPDTVKIFIEAEEAAHDGRKEASGSRLIYDLYRLIGQRVISCDNDVDSGEVAALAQYLMNLKQYINANSSYGTVIDSDPDKDAADARSQLKDENRFSSLAVKKVISETARRREKEDAEFRKSMNSSSSTSSGSSSFGLISSSGSAASYTRPSSQRTARSSGSSYVSRSQAPWDPHYYSHPCPYCGQRKVRRSKWDDKMYSAAFWGYHSYKLHCRFKCDGCGRMWN